MIKNYSRAIFLLSDDVRAIECAYEQNGAGRSTFKTFDETIKVDDYVVVQTDTRHNMTVVKVVTVDTDPEIESDRHMNWVVGKVDMVTFDAQVAQEKEAMEVVRSAERKAQRAELRKKLLDSSMDEIKSLPIYNIRNGNGKPAVEQPPAAEVVDPAPELGD